MSDPFVSPAAREVAADLLRIGAVSFRPRDPFVWASGMKSPVYCDNRLTMSYPSVRERIAETLADLVRTRCSGASLVAGTATAGIPHAAWASDRLGLPMVYVRSSSKDHGQARRIEGRIEPGAQAVVIEDLVSTGGSSLSAVEALRDEGAVVEDVIAIFTYAIPSAHAAFEEMGVRLATVTSIDVLLEAAASSGALVASEMASLRAWRRDPGAWHQAATAGASGRPVRTTDL